VSTAPSVYRWDKPGYVRLEVSQSVANSIATPESLELRRHLELEGRRGEVRVRRILIGVLVLVPALALLGFLGQRPTTSYAANEAAALDVYSPTRVRGGLLFTTRIGVEARRELRQAAIVLDPGWFEGMQVNSITPDPVTQGSADGRAVLGIGTIAAGEKSVTFIQFQVDPTNVGHRPQNVELWVQGREVLRIPRSITVLP
jgi:hypothetical protein